VWSALGGNFLTADHSKFINNTGIGILSSVNTIMICISHSEFVDNIASQCLIDFVGTKMISVTHSHFSGNANSMERYNYRRHSLIYLDGFEISLSFIEFINNKADNAAMSIRAVDIATILYRFKFN
jgi:hypothetical protein